MLLLVILQNNKNCPKCFDTYCVILWQNFVESSKHQKAKIHVCIFRCLYVWPAMGTLTLSTVDRMVASAGRIQTALNFATCIQLRQVSAIPTQVHHILHIQHCSQDTLNLNLKLSPYYECCIVSFGWFSGVWILYVDVSEHNWVFRNVDAYNSDAGESHKRNNTWHV